MGVNSLVFIKQCCLCVGDNEVIRQLELSKVPYQWPVDVLTVLLQFLRLDLLTVSVRVIKLDPSFKVLSQVNSADEEGVFTLKLS
jgi:hypothetical protein